jgi:hypothetical protein
VRRVRERHALVVDKDVRVVVGGLGIEAQPDDEGEGVGKAGEREFPPD